MRNKLNWRIAALKNGLQDATAYRLEFLFEVLGSAAVPAAIQTLFWYAIFKVGGTQELGGLRYEDFIAYTLTSILFTQIRGGDHDFELQEMIRSGGLSNYLLRPCGAVEFVYIRGVAPKLFIAGLSLIAGLTIGYFYGITPDRLLGAMTLALIGNIIHYQIGAALATVAFYWEEGYSVLMVKNLLVSLLCGELIPLNLFPTEWQWVWKSTPFYLYVFGPTQYALGRWTHAEFFSHLTIGLAWIGAGWLLVNGTWKSGIKRYLSLGG
jgi:ABC-2 type transport system permease protein